MTVAGLVSAKHSPGVTTAAIALAVATGDGSVVIEADAAGGDLAARARLPIDPGLLTMAAAGRHSGSRLNLHTQPLPSGVDVVIGPTDPNQATVALSTVGDRLAAATREHGAGYIDCGRWSPMTTRAILINCDAVIVVTEPSVSGIEHVRSRVDALVELGPPVTVLLVGDRPYAVDEVEQALALPVLGALAVDNRGVPSLYSGPPRLARKTALCRSARSALERLEDVTDLSEVSA